MSDGTEWDLSELEGAASVVVAVPDATRPIDFAATLEPLLQRLAALGIDAQIEVALGLHRPMNELEIEPLTLIAERFGVSLSQHDARRKNFAPHLRACDAIICVGLVEPHQYAGFSGGIKTVAIGCAPADLIAHSHRIELLRDPRLALGRYRDNPFQDELWDRVAHLPPFFGLYLVPDPNGPSQIFFGPARPTMDRAVEAARSLHFQTFPRPFPWLSLAVPESKASSFYQASRAATYAGLVSRPAIAPGGLIIIEAEIPEGIGQGRGERACAEAMLRGREALLAELNAEGPINAPGGAQRAYVIARTLHRFDIAVVGSVCGVLEPLEAMRIGQFATIAEALQSHSLSAPGGHIDDPFHRVPTLPATPNDALA